MISVLIIDDDEKVRSKALRCLASADVQLASAANGRLGLELARKQLPHIVIADVDMPEMNGFELLAALRDDEVLSSTQVMMLTSQDSRESMRLGMMLGADDYLTKPFTDEELKSAFAGLLKKRGLLQTAITSAVKTQGDQLRRMFGERLDGARLSTPTDLQTVVIPAQNQRVINAAVLFTDIRSFTSMAEKLTAPEVEELLTVYFQRLCEPVLDNGGDFLRMLGDGLMAVFSHGADLPARPERRALQAAAQMSAIVVEFRTWLDARFPDRGLPPFEGSIGLHCGDVAVSQLDVANDKAPLPTGGTVDIAVRLQEMGMESGWAVASSRALVEQAGAGVSQGRSASLAVGDNEAPVQAEEVLGVARADENAEETTWVIRTGEKTVQLGAGLPGWSQTVARVHIDAKENARLAARAVKDALGDKLASFKTHRFQAGEAPLRLAGYGILRRIGSGGMSSIYLARREADGDLVVLKVLDTSPGESEQLARFIREYTLVSRISHPNIIRIFNQGFGQEHAYIAMEYFENGDLRRRMMGALGDDQALRIAIQVADALAAAHELGIVHRDLKPENLMVRADGSVVLADFGIAKSVKTPGAADPTMITHHGELIGSPSYMSPEQIIGPGEDVDARSDLYSLGVLLFELLTGRRPFEAATFMAMLAMRANAAPPALPEALWKYQPLIHALMAKEPSLRPASAREVLVELNTLLRSLNVA